MLRTHAKQLGEKLKSSASSRLKEITVETKGGSIVLSQDFLEHIKSEFDIGPRFLEAYLAGFSPPNLQPKKWQDLAGDSEMSRIYVHFALSNVARGRGIRETILQHTNLRNGSFLDIGCAYGGALIAFAQIGFNVLGVEIDERFGKLGQVNCDEHGLRDVVRIQDFYELEPKGEFAIILVNDVIEHVAYPNQALKQMAGHLKPGGLLYMEIPNRWSLTHIGRDGHFGLFGINLLSHYSAKAYYEYYHSQFAEKSYSCGEFYPLAWYRDKLGQYGLTSEVIAKNRNWSNEEIHANVEKLFQYYTAYRKNNRLNEILRGEIDERFIGYMADFWTAYHDFYSGKKDRFVSDYLDDFWTVVATKNG